MAAICGNLSTFWELFVYVDLRMAALFLGDIGKIYTAPAILIPLQLE
jgi:hypothetical protein